MTAVTVTNRPCLAPGHLSTLTPIHLPGRAMRVLTLLLCCLIPLSACAQDARFTPDPDAARLVTEDLDRFWAAWDAAAAVDGTEARSAVFQAQYLDAGSPGLEAFARLRIGDGAKLLKAIDKHPRYYASLRARTAALAAELPGIRETLGRMKVLYPEAVFPDVYFLMGRMNSGGTLDRTGLLIGVDMFGGGPGAPLEELGDWHREVVGESGNLPVIVAHEWVHFQQLSDTGSQPTLLQAAIGEGVADFIAELGAGRHLNDHVHAWAEPRAATLWTEFRGRMNGTDYAGWLYDAGEGSTDGRPADLGYWMGYRIASGYYARAADKTAAIREMLRIDDFDAFLKASGVPEEFEGRGG